ncbi:MAG: hypothetical protein R2911_08765 [Caldilineaceae bacterium]
MREPLPNVVKTGSQLEIYAVWQAATSPAADYTVTVQFLNAAGQPQSQVDLPLPNGSQNWVAGEISEQMLRLNAPSAPGAYRLIAALYDANAPGQPRLQKSGGNDFVSLREILVEE